MSVPSPTPIRLTPVYYTKQVDEVLSLYEGPAQLEHTGRFLDGNVKVELFWAPVAVRQFAFTESVASAPLSRGDATLHLTSLAAKADVALLGVGLSGKYAGTLLRDFAFGNPKVSSIVFHLV